MADSLRNLLLRRLIENRREDDGADGAADRPKRPDEADGDAEVSLRHVERGGGVAVEGDPAEGEHGQELDCHEPVEIVWRDESCEPEKEGLHEDSEGELEVYVLNVVDEGGDQTATNKLADAEEAISFGAHKRRVWRYLPGRKRVEADFDGVGCVQVQDCLRVQG